MDRILITNIQRFSIHDGPGIRTTIFLKGCSIRCPWCSNPENLTPYPQEYSIEGIDGVYGEWYETEKLVMECLKDNVYYEGKYNNKRLWNIKKYEDIKNLPGGVTFSGGEPLLQMESLVTVCNLLHCQNIHIVAETSLFVPSNLLDIAIQNIDFFYVDIKIMEPKLCRNIEHGSIDLYKINFDKIMKSGVPVVVRIPVIGGFTDDKQNRFAVKQLIQQYRTSILKIELIKEHSLAIKKYKSLNMETSYSGVDDSLLEIYKFELNDIGILIEICAI